MNYSSYYKTMANYNEWMNQNLYAICAEIPDAKRKEDLGAFFKSIHGTLNHILIGDLVWMGRFTNQPFVTKLDRALYENFDELKQKRKEVDRQILAWAQQLSPQWLDAPFTWTSISNPVKSSTKPAWLLVTHFFNHQTHHRGQLTTLLSQLGYDPGVTDLPYMPTLQAL